MESPCAARCAGGPARGSLLARPLAAAARGSRRCERDDRAVVACPECRRGEACPLDVWPHYLARAALGVPAPGSDKPAVALKSFLNLNGAQTGRGVLTTWLKQERRHLVGATAWLVHEEHRRRGHEAAAQSFAYLAWEAGVREPRLAASYAGHVAPSGDEAALRRGADACAEALAIRDGSTFEGWTELGAKRAQLLSRLSRPEVRPSRWLEEGGNPVPFRRHHPRTPRRSRPRRFSF